MTLRRLTLGLAITAALLGAAHTALTPLLYRAWALDSLWFVGTGLAMLAAAAANVLALGASGRLARILIVLIDLAMAGFFAAAWPVLAEPQVIVGGLLFAALAGCMALGGAVPLALRPAADLR